MVVADGQGVPVSCRLASANPAEVRLAEDAVDHIKRRHPWGLKLIADRAYDSDKLRNSLKTRGIDLVCPHRRGRVRPATQDERKLRRYRVTAGRSSAPSHGFRASEGSSSATSTELTFTELSSTSRRPSSPYATCTFETGSSHMRPFAHICLYREQNARQHHAAFSAGPDAQ